MSRTMYRAPFAKALRFVVLALVAVAALAAGQTPVAAQSDNRPDVKFMAPNCPVSREQQHKPFPCDDMLQPPVTASVNGEVSQNEPYRLAIYYAIPADIPFDQAVFDRIRDASREMQAWYQVATGGVTWELAFPEVVTVYQAQQTRQFYTDNGNWWGSLLSEMGSAGVPIWSPGTVTAIWAQGAGWWAGAAQGCGGDCGIALLGVELFPEFNNPAFSGGACPDPDGQGVEAWPCTPVGAYAHELGHTLGLIHPADDPATALVAGHSIMQTHWNYPDQAPPSDRPWGFLRSERESLHTNPFMKSGIELVQIYQDAEIAVNLPASGTPPMVDFDIEVKGNEIRFANNTQGAALFYWTFGDYSVSNEVAPTHTYLQNGSYTVTLRASSAQAMIGVVRRTVVVEEAPVVEEVPVDIKPRGCPSPLNTRARGVLPVAILGTSSFDITTLDPASIELEGVAPLRWNRADVATPFMPFTGKTQATDCTTKGPDGFQDLTLKFDTQAVVAALGTVTDRQVRVLKLTGKLKSEFGGTPIAGEDVVVMLKKK